MSTLSTLAKDPASPATVLVSHHVEEIPPGFTHALLLRGGRVVADGPIDEVVTEEHLAETFDMPLVLTHEAGRWSARRRSRRRPSADLRTDRLNVWSGWVITCGPPGSCWRSLSAWPRWSAST